MHPFDRCRIAHLLDQIAGMLAGRSKWVVVDLAAGNDRHPLVEQAGERADEPRLGLTSLAQKDYVVTGEQGILELRHDGVLVPEDSFEQGVAGSDAGHSVSSDLLFHRGRLPARGLQIAERCERALPCVDHTRFSAAHAWR